MCVKPAKGTDSIGTTVGEVITAIAGAEAAGIAGVAGAVVLAPGLLIAGAPATPVVAALGGVAALVSATAAATGAATGIPNFIDSNRSPDNLYIKMNGKKVWPSDGHKDFKGGQSEDVSIPCPMDNGSCKVQLMEYDWGSGDDNLGEFELREGTPAGVYTCSVDCPAEDSSYLIEVNVT